MHRALMVRRILILLAIVYLGGCTAAEVASGEGTGGEAGSGREGPGGAGGNPGGNGGGTAAGGDDGTGGGGGDGGSSGPGTGWWDDPAIWTAIPGSEVWRHRCNVLQADPDGIRKQLLTWASCGPGCERASLDLGFDQLPSSPSIIVADGAVLSGAIITVNTGWMRDGRYREFRSSIRLDDGMLVAMAQLDSSHPPPGGVASCIIDRPARSIVSAVAVVDDTETTQFVYGFADARTGTHTWFPPWAPDPLCGALPVETEDGGSRLFFSCGAVGYLEQGSAEAHVVSGDAAVAYQSAWSYRDLVVWSEPVPGGTSRVRSWSDRAGTRTLIDTLPGWTCEVAVSADRVAGWSVPANGSCDLLGPGMQLWHMGLDRGGPVGEVQWVPALQGWDVLPDLLTSRNGYAAFYATLQDGTGTRSKGGVVVRLSDGAARRIVPQPGHEVHWGTVAVSDRHVYWAEGKRIKYDGQVAAVYRHDLAHFDTLGVPLGTGGD